MLCDQQPWRSIYDTSIFEGDSCPASCVLELEALRADGELVRVQIPYIDCWCVCKEEVMFLRTCQPYCILYWPAKMMPSREDETVKVAADS